MLEDRPPPPIPKHADETDHHSVPQGSSTENPQEINRLARGIPSYHEVPALHAGFWARVAAYFIDVILFTISILLLFGLVAGVSAIAADNNGNSNSTGVNAVFLFLFWTGCAIFEATRLQATPGKHFLGLQVVDSKGERPSAGQAFGRNYGKFLSLVILYVGFMLAGWTSRKQGLHDLMAGTFVVHKKVLADYKDGKQIEGGYSTTNPAAVAGIIVVVLFLFIGILAAIAIPAYQDYIARSQMSEGIQLAGGAEVGLAEYMQNYQRWPDTLSEVYSTADISPAGRYVSGVSMSGCYGQTCGIVAVMRDTQVNAHIAGTSMEIWTNDGGETWHCGPGGTNPVPEKYLPASCRDQGAP